MFIFVRKTLNCRDLGTCLNGLTTLWLQRCSLYDLDGISCFNSLKVTSILSLNSAEKFSKSVWCGLLPYAMESIKSLALMESYTYHQLPGNLLHIAKYQCRWSTDYHPMVVLLDIPLFIATLNRPTLLFIMLCIWSHYFACFTFRSVRWKSFWCFRAAYFWMIHVARQILCSIFHDYHVNDSPSWFCCIFMSPVC